MRRDFVLYILPFGLVRLRTFNLVHGLVRCTHFLLVFMRVRGGCDNQRCYNEKPQRVNRTRGCEWHHGRKRDWFIHLYFFIYGFWNLKKKQLVEIKNPIKRDDFRSSPRPDQNSGFETFVLFLSALALFPLPLLAHSHNETP